MLLLNRMGCSWSESARASLKSHASHPTRKLATHRKLFLSFLQATECVCPNPTFKASKPQTLKPIYRFRGSHSKCFSFCFLPLPRLPKVLHYFWPLVSESCFLGFVQTQKKKTLTLPKCSQSSHERQEKKQGTDKSIRKQCSNTSWHESSTLAI